jgi:hypothetical protein
MRRRLPADAQGRGDDAGDHATIRGEAVVGGRLTHTNMVQAPPLLRCCC